ncbi:DUF3596 domain-containing protein [Pseudoxanthomonas sp.]|uniref:Arm DNA-binding domain-containing protein n=1 Tax=Pseudoxanthomonas sp. TaxID=1871049 RepID=UPI0025CEB9B4|nr:DUF3596 domain-containing protein [Pseudoxanthomonas sp.]
MANVRCRPETGCLFIDFRYRGVRCREQTTLQDTNSNRRTLEALANRIKREMAKGTFNYRAFFPDSARANQFDDSSGSTPSNAPARRAAPATTPTLGEFTETWYRENLPRWRQTHAETVHGTLHQHILPKLGEKPLSEITRADLLTFRAELSKQSTKGAETLSPSRINHIMTPLRMLLAEASERYEFLTPFRNIKPLRLPKLDIQPLSLDEVNRALGTVRKDWHPYLATRFFTGMRTGEINALEWKHIDFEHDLILVRQSIVKGKLENTKTDGSMRDIPMVPLVRTALLEQQKLVSEDCRWVFAQRNGDPINLVNFTNRVWHPLLRHLGLAPRRPYQTRHTAATLMLASGENPEWVARTLGHANTEMLFRVYSRYVPNLTRNDGKAFTGLVTASSLPISTGIQAKSKQEGPTAPLSVLTRKQLEALVAQLQQR